MHYKTATEALMRLRGVYARALSIVSVAEALAIVEAGIAAEQPLVAIALEYEAHLTQELEDTKSAGHASALRARLAQLKPLLDPIRPPPVPPSYEELTETLKVIVATVATGPEARDLAHKMLERMPK